MSAELFREAFEASVAGAPDSARALRQAAYDRFLELGLPDSRDEEWRGTSVAALARSRFTAARPAGVALQDLKPLTFGVLGRHRIVFVNGILDASLSTLDALPGGLTVHRHAALMAQADPARDRSSLATITDPFNALNLALANDGVVLAVPVHTVIEDPVYLYYYSTGGVDTPMAAVRNATLVTLQGQLKLVEAYGGAPGARYFASAYSHVTLGAGAHLQHVKVQRDSTAALHVARLGVRSGRDSRFSNLSVNLGAALCRHDIDVRFDAEGGECSLDGLFIASGEQQTDTHTRIDHAKPRCSSRELYKGVLDGRARGVFHGRVVVQKDAQKTDAVQANKNLLLSREALVNSTPQLEILADDVKCKHGSTTGQLDATALFYLRSRGIGEQAARSLLTYAFASDVVQKLPVAELRAGLEAHLQEALPVAEEAVA